MSEEPTIEDLILGGIIEVAALSESGEMLYSFTQKAKEELPELYQMHTSMINMEIMYFWEHGFIDIFDWESPNPMIKLTEKALIKEEVDKLSQDKKDMLAEIKRILRVV